jgi:phage/plasmid-like protein (TIGR03299 family)
MAANINITNGKSSFAGTKPAWHGLGQIVEGAMTSKEALKLANLDFTVSKKQLYTASGLIAENTFGTFRDDTDTYLGTVGKSYTVVQNVDCFTFFDAIVGQDQAIFETAGALGKGEKVFITAKLPDSVKVGDDIIDQYLFLYNSHDGSAAVTCAFTPVRIVCNNTLTAALRSNSNKISIKHTTNVVDNLYDAHKLMGIVSNLSDVYANNYNQLLGVKVDDKKIRELIEQALMPSDKYFDISPEEYSTRFKNITDEVYTFTKEHETQQGIEDTLWGIYNGITGFYNYQEYDDADDKVNSIFFGNYNKKAQKVFNLLQKELV